MLMVMTLDDNRKTANADQTVKGNVGENQGKAGSWVEQESAIGLFLSPKCLIRKSLVKMVILMMLLWYQGENGEMAAF